MNAAPLKATEDSIEKELEKLHLEKKRLITEITRGKIKNAAQSYMKLKEDELDSVLEEIEHLELREEKLRAA